MTAAAARSMLGVVELLDADGLADTHGRGSFARIRDSYIERLKKWARTGDPWRLVGDHRFCVVLSGVSSPAELELATAKLAMWPTPTKSDYKGSGPTMVRKDGKRRGDRLDYATERNHDGSPVLPGGALNPTWVEYLMAWPSEWTDLKPLGMDKFRQWLQLLSEFCQKGGCDNGEAT